jgi:hypothetical protein
MRMPLGIYRMLQVCGQATNFRTRMACMSKVQLPAKLLDAKARNSAFNDESFAAISCGHTDWALATLLTTCMPRVTSWTFDDRSPLARSAKVQRNVQSVKSHMVLWLGAIHKSAPVPAPIILPLQLLTSLPPQHIPSSPRYSIDGTMSDHPSCSAKAPTPNRDKQDKADDLYNMCLPCNTSPPGETFQAGPVDGPAASASSRSLKAADLNATQIWSMDDEQPGSVHLAGALPYRDKMHKGKSERSSKSQHYCTKDDRRDGLPPRITATTYISGTPDDDDNDLQFGF